MSEHLTAPITDEERERLKELRELAVHKRDEMVHVALRCLMYAERARNLFTTLAENEQISPDDFAKLHSEADKLFWLIEYARMAINDR